MMDYQDHMAGNDSSFNGSHHGSTLGSARASLIQPSGSNNNNLDTKSLNRDDDLSSMGESEDAESSHTDSVGVKWRCCR